MAKELRANSSLLRAFNIRPEEEWQVKILFLHYFFQGIGIALFYVVATTLFLDFFKITKLPYVFVLAGVVLLISGRIYAYLEHHLPIRRVMFGVLGMLLALTILSWVGLQAVGLPSKEWSFLWLPFALMVIYRVIYLLSNLQFWGLSALMFDIRQSKRLFGLISAGDRPAKLLAYLSISLLVKYLGVSLGALLLIAAVAYIASLYYLKQLMDSPDVQKLTQTDHDHSQEEEEEDHGRREAGSVLGNFFGNDYILSLSALSMIVVAALSFIEFEFYTEVKYEFKELDSLAVFLSLFFAIENGVTILSKFFFTGRIINKLGVKWTMLTLPVGILILAVFIMIDHVLLGEAEESLSALWMFGFMSMVANILYSILHAPTFLSLFQPLNQHLRLHGHTVTKGFMEPLGLLVAGGILLIGEAMHVMGVFLLDYAIAAITVVWIAVVVNSYKKYLRILDGAIQKHFLEGSEIGVQDETTIEMLKKKLESSHPEEVIYSLELLRKQEIKGFDKVVVNLLRHPSEEVKMHALNTIEELKIDSADEEIGRMIDSEAPIWLKETAIRIYCTIDEDAVERILPRLESSDPGLRRGIITGLMRSGGVEAIVIAGQELLKLIDSQKREDQLLAASIIGDLGIKNFYKPILQFMDVDDIQLRSKAILASGKVKNEKLLPRTISFLTDKQLKDEAMIALEQFGEKALEMIEERINKGGLEGKYQLSKFIQLCGRIESKKSVQILVRFLDYEDAKIRDEVLNSLSSLQFKVLEGEQEQIYEKLDTQFKNAYWTLQSQFLILDQVKNRPLQTALDIELDRIKERVFILLTFIYNTKKIQTAREALSSTEKERRANALEILDNTVSKRIQAKLFPLIEDIELTSKLEAYKKQFEGLQVTQSDMFYHILEMGSRKFNRWTQASALHCIDAKPEHIPLLSNYLDTPFKIINENAFYAIERLLENGQLNGERSKLQHIMAKHQSIKNQGSLMEIEKIVILKGTSMFANTPENILVDIAAIVKEERKSPGERIFAQGDIGNCMYLIYEGNVSIHAGETEFVVLKKRDFFGELALLDPEPRSASATAKTDTLLLRIDQGPFFELMGERSEVSLGILKTLCQRLRNQNNTITQLKSEVSKMQPAG